LDPKSRELLEDILDLEIEAVSGEIWIQNTQNWTYTKNLEARQDNWQKNRASGPDQAAGMRQLARPGPEASISDAWLLPETS